MSHSRQIKIIEAFDNGKKVRYKNRWVSGPNTVVSGNHLFNFMDNIYEIVEVKKTDWTQI